jgi:serine-type D-Ala-D-Ala carboxypeptidase (penicillin-binding protein 5/6)
MAVVQVKSDHRPARRPHQPESPRKFTTTATPAGRDRARGKPRSAVTGEGPAGAGPARAAGTIGLVRNALRAAVIAALIGWPAAVIGVSAPPTPQGSAWLLVDGPTGEVLAQNAADVARPMASTTKMMTALVALESGNLDRLVTVPPEAAQVGESSAGLRAGERLPLRDLVTALMIGSGNDAAIAVAHGIAGSEAEFVARMNAKAREMGLDDTDFSNPHGLDEDGHRSTPHDLIKIGRAVMARPELRRVVGERTATIPGRNGPRVLESENDLLSIMADADGIKTGHTNGAGYALVAHATSPALSRDLYAVLMGEPDRTTRARDAKALLEWGFSNFSRPVVMRKGQAVVRLDVQGRPGLTVPLAPPSAVPATIRLGTPVSMRVVAPSMAVAPVTRGQRLGRVEVLQGATVVARSALVAGADVPAPGFADSLRTAFAGIGSMFT